MCITMSRETCVILLRVFYLFCSIKCFIQVQLATTHTSSTTIPPAVLSAPPNSAASKILALIGDEEGTYQTSLNDTYHEMGEKTFKGLRRALPLTRSKIDWDK